MIVRLIPAAISPQLCRWMRLPGSVAYSDKAQSGVLKLVVNALFF